MEVQIAKIETKDILKNNSNVVLDFYADWCKPCQTLLPTIDKLANELKDDVVIKKINVDDNQELAMQFSIRNIPTLIFFKNGKPLEKHTGLITENNLRNKINRLK